MVTDFKSTWICKFIPNITTFNKCWVWVWISLCSDTYVFCYVSAPYSIVPGINIELISWFDRTHIWYGYRSHSNQPMPRSTKKSYKITKPIKNCPKNNFDIFNIFYNLFYIWFMKAINEIAIMRVYNIALCASIIVDGSNLVAV